MRPRWPLASRQTHRREGSVEAATLVVAAISVVAACILAAGALAGCVWEALAGRAWAVCILAV